MGVLVRALRRPLPDAEPAPQDIRVVGWVVAGRIGNAGDPVLRNMLDKTNFQEFLEGFGNPFETLPGTLSQHFGKGSDARGHEAWDIAGLWPRQDEQPEEFGIVGQLDELVVIPNARIHLAEDRSAHAFPPAICLAMRMTSESSQARTAAMAS